MSLRILIVDDSPIIRAVIEKNIRLAGIEVSACLHAGDGQQALDQLADQWVDLALIDINMPVMNGVELIEKMKADAVLATVPIIVVSTEGSATRIEALNQMGIASYLRKPFTPEQFKTEMTNVLESRDVA